MGDIPILTGLWNGLTGKVDFRARAPSVSTAPGTQAIQGRAAQGAQDVLSGAYSAATNVRGGASPMAFREAQRMGVQGQAQVYSDALNAQRELEQAAMQQRAQAEMQAQQINADIAKQESGGIGRLAGAALMGAALLSDERQKEIYSDFATKEFHGSPAPTWTVPVGSYQPQALRPGVDASQLSNPAIAAQLQANREGPYAGALRASTYSPLEEQARLDAQRQASADQAARLEARRKEGLGLLGMGLMQSDKKSKELLQENSLLRAALEGQQRGKGASVAMVQQQQAKESERLTPEQAARPDLPEVLSRTVPGQPVTQLYPDVDMQPGLVTRAGAPVTDPRRLPVVTVVHPAPAPPTAPPAPPRASPPYLVATMPPMTSDFADKEIAQNRRALAPIDPVVYRYTPESSYRQALEVSRTPEEIPAVYEDKREPRPGIVAQQLLKSPAFRSSVLSTPTGLKVQGDRALSTALGMMAGLDKRLRKVEKGGAKRASR